MSHFEYVPVAVALLYALAIGRLLSGLSFSLGSGRQYWVHTTWLLNLLLASVMTWWTLWRLNEVAWTPIRFIWVLSLPSLLYLRANILLGRPGAEPDSYYDYFYEQRRWFFGLGIGISFWIAMTPWVQGLVPWFEPGPVHIKAAFLASISFLGFWFRSPIVHGVLAILSLISAASGFFIVRITV